MIVKDRTALTALGAFGRIGRPDTDGDFTPGGGSQPTITYDQGEANAWCNRSYYSDALNAKCKVQGKNAPWTPSGKAERGLPAPTAVAETAAWCQANYPPAVTVKTVQGRFGPPRQVKSVDPTMFNKCNRVAISGVQLPDPPWTDAGKISRQLVAVAQAAADAPPIEVPPPPAGPPVSSGGGGGGYSRPTPLGPRIVPGGGVIPRAPLIAPPGRPSGFPILPPWAPSVVSSDSGFTPQDRQAVQDSAAAAAVLETPSDSGGQGSGETLAPTDAPRPSAADFEVNLPPPPDYAPQDFSPSPPAPEDFGPPSQADFDPNPLIPVDPGSGDLETPVAPPPKKPGGGLLLGLGAVAALFLGFRR